MTLCNCYSSLISSKSTYSPSSWENSFLCLPCAVSSFILVLGSSLEEEPDCCLPLKEYPTPDNSADDAKSDKQDGDYNDK